MTKSDKLYTHVKIPRALSMRIQELVINQGPHGYRNISEFVIEAVRIKLQYLEEMRSKVQLR